MWSRHPCHLGSQCSYLHWPSSLKVSFNPKEDGLSGHSPSCWHLWAVSLPRSEEGEWSSDLCEEVSCFLLPRCPVPGAGAGVEPGPLEALSSPGVSVDSTSHRVLTAGTGVLRRKTQSCSDGVLWSQEQRSIEHVSPETTLHPQRHVRLAPRGPRTQPCVAVPGGPGRRQTQPT